MLATGTDEFSSLADNSYLGRTAILQADAGISLWSSLLGGSYDDASVSAFSSVSLPLARRGISGSFSLSGKLPITKPQEDLTILRTW
jgi:hypothetical protein